MKKVEKLDRTKIVVYNYCSKEFIWSKSKSYDTYWRHVNDKNLTEATGSKSRGQNQIARYIYPNTQLFCYYDTNNREELVHMVVIEYLPFRFGEKVGFVNCYQRAVMTYLVRRMKMKRN